MAKEKKVKLTAHMKKVIAKGEKAWEEGKVIRVKRPDMIKFLRSLEK